MRIAITADPELPVPPVHYGGIERVIHLLVEGMTGRGHEVVLFAHPASSVSCELVPYSGTASQSAVDTARNATLIARRVWRDSFDIAHSFSRLQYLSPLAWHRVPKLMSYQRPITPASILWARRLFGPSLEFTACSRSLVEAAPLPGTWHVVANGVPLGRFTFQPAVAADAPLVFLGRLEEIKGPHLAIEAAIAAGRSIVLAGNIEPAHQDFFDARVRPWLNGGAVRYVGPVDDHQKNELLGRAAALLMPIVWDEPFGIVMAEALACGTPVVGFSRGAVPEIVASGVTGFVVSDIAEMVEGISRLPAISRSACRLDAEARFSEGAIVDAYEHLYRERLSPPPDRPPVPPPVRPPVRPPVPDEDGR